MPCVHLVMVVEGMDFLLCHGPAHSKLLLFHANSTVSALGTVCLMKKKDDQSDGLATFPLLV